MTRFPCAFPIVGLVLTSAICSTLLIFATQPALVAGGQLTLDMTGLTAYWQFNGNTKNSVTGISLFNMHKTSLVNVRRLPDRNTQVDIFRVLLN